MKNKLLYYLDIKVNGFAVWFDGWLMMKGGARMLGSQFPNGVEKV